MNLAVWENDYDILTKYRADHNIWLLMGKKDKKVYIGKCMEVYNRNVMQAMGTFENLHIPKIFDVREEDGQLYVVEEYISGETLAERMECGRLPSEQEAAQIAVQVCEGLEFLHSREKPIIHRDLKPPNIIVSSDHVVKLIDYNAARCFEEGVSRDTVLIGTSGYAAPEQFGFAQTDARTDIYALGIVLKDLLMGSHEGILRCSQQMSHIIEKCTHMDPEKRYKTAADVRRDLESLTEEQKGAEEKKDDRTGPGPFWPIPGFRSGKLWHMLLAVPGYILIFQIARGVEMESNRDYPMICLLDKICIGLWLLFLVALATDYAGIKRYFPFLSHPNKMVRIAGYVLWGAAVMVLAALFPEVVQSFMG